MCLPRFNTDGHESPRRELVHRDPLLVQNGIRWIDDFRFFHGAQKVVDEYYMVPTELISLNWTDTTGRVAIRPSVT
jgi:hypothetical protein